MSTYEAEKKFLNKKLVPQEVNWDVLPAVSQLVSPNFSEVDAKGIVSRLKDALYAKCARVFTQLTFTRPSKLSGGSRVVVDIKLLREYFGNEIETSWGGGGRGLNPNQTTPKPPGGRV